MPTTYTERIIVEALLLLLEKDEWGLTFVAGSRVVHCCPKCERKSTVGHKNNCAWKKAIDKMKKAMEKK